MGKKDNSSNTIASSYITTEPDYIEKDLLSAEIPEQLHSIFSKAQIYINRYFNNRKENAKEGMISISGERYLLLRADTLALEFFDSVHNIYGANDEAHSVINALLFDISHTMGRSDARRFHESMGLTNPLEKLSAGPLHFAHTGWAKVHIEPESNPTPDENYTLYFEHTYSFEADS